MQGPAFPYVVADSSAVPGAVALTELVMAHGLCVEVDFLFICLNLCFIFAGYPLYYLGIWASLEVHVALQFYACQLCKRGDPGFLIEESEPFGSVLM